MTISLVVVDDDPGFRRRARMLLAAGGFEVVGEAGDGAEAHEVVARLRPRAVLVDVGLPDTDGLTLTAQLCASAAAPAVVVMSGRDASDYGPRVQRSGALGFIAKVDLSAESLHAALAQEPAA
jgi:DNA-binding NarL/FixJ family response regulator